MPVRARASKRRRMSEAEELEAWETLFATGYDFFGDLGLSHKERTPEAIAAAKEAWSRLGDRFLANRTDPGRTDGWACEPWALETFGPPPSSRERRRR